MKPRNSRWLDTALRAQQARTLDHHYRVHDTQATHAQALQQETEALQSLQALAASWRGGRDGGQLTQDLDGLYRRYHALLSVQADSAGQARAVQEQALDAALQQLRQSHALQQGLDRTLQRRDRRQAQLAQARERNVAGEHWLLAQAGKKGQDE